VKVRSPRHEAIARVEINHHNIVLGEEERERARKKIVLTLLVS
jgi:hypothetical protein